MSDNRIVCTACGGINRLPDDRPALAAKCGTCHAPLFGTGPADLDATALERQITKGTVPVVVDIWAPWCGPCRAMAPQYAMAAKTLEPRARLLKLNSDDNQAFSARLGIRGIPTMVLFRNGRESDRISGAMSAQQITDWVTPRL